MRGNFYNILASLQIKFFMCIYFIAPFFFQEIEEKVKKAEQEVEKQEKTLQDAEDEKKSAEREGRSVPLISTV